MDGMGSLNGLKGWNGWNVRLGVPSVAVINTVLVEEGGADTQLRNARGHTALDLLVGGENALEETRMLLSKKGE